MFLRCLFAAAIALLLSGCTGWWSETRLIPAGARDPAGLSGVYVSGEDRANLSPTAEGFLRTTDLTGNTPPSDAAFALLREEAPRPSLFAEAESDESEPPRAPMPDRSYLMEIPFTGDDGETAYTYAIGRIGFAPDGSAYKLELFTLLCSEASEVFAARKEPQVCIFDDYARLRAAAFDALAWYDDARMSLETTTWEREVEIEDIEPDAP
ncbi:MAG: hypothetical protein C0471_04615 [Erythrobacter sp.]|nr:hypothetical protein [Erythrobacter sp.]